MANLVLSSDPVAISPDYFEVDHSYCIINMAICISIKLGLFHKDLNIVSAPYLKT